MSGLRISEAASLAIHTLLVLAAKPARTVPASEIAAVLRASKDHLAKVLQRLARGAFVASARGPKGGFTLARPAAGLTLLEVYEYIEGSYNVRDCLFDVRVCGAGKCPMGGLLFSVNMELMRFLAETTFGELALTFEKNVKNAEDRLNGE